MLLKKNQQEVAQQYSENYNLTELNLIKDSNSFLLKQ